MEFNTAVLAPGVIIVAFKGRTLFAVTYYLDLVITGAEQSHLALDRIGPSFTQGKIIFARTSLIGVPFECDDRVRIAGQIRGMRFNHAAILRQHLAAVVFKIDDTDCQRAVGIIQRASATLYALAGAVGLCPGFLGRWGGTR